MQQLWDVYSKTFSISPEMQVENEKALSVIQKEKTESTWFQWISDVTQTAGYAFSAVKLIMTGQAYLDTKNVIDEEHKKIEAALSKEDAQQFIDFEQSISDFLVQIANNSNKTILDRVLGSGLVSSTAANLFQYNSGWVEDCIRLNVARAFAHFAQQLKQDNNTAHPLSALIALIAQPIVSKQQVLQDIANQGLNAEQKQAQYNKIFAQMAKDILILFFPNQVEDIVLPDSLKNLLNAYTNQKGLDLFVVVQQFLADFLQTSYLDMQVGEQAYKQWSDTIQKHIGNSDTVKDMAKAPALFATTYAQHFLKTNPAALSMILSVLNGASKDTFIPTNEEALKKARLIGQLGQQDLARWTLHGLQSMLEDPALEQTGILLNQWCQSLVLGLIVKGCNFSQGQLDALFTRVGNFLKEIKATKSVDADIGDKIIEGLPIPTSIQSTIAQLITTQLQGFANPIATAGQTYDAIHQLYQEGSNAEIKTISQQVSQVLIKAIITDDQPVITDDFLENNWKTYLPTVPVNKEMIDLVKTNVNQLSQQSRVLIEESVQAIVYKSLSHMIEEHPDKKLTLLNPILEALTNASVKLKTEDKKQFIEAIHLQQHIESNQARIATLQKQRTDLSEDPALAPLNKTLISLEQIERQMRTYEMQIDQQLMHLKLKRHKLEELKVLFEKQKLLQPALKLKQKEQDDRSLLKAACSLINEKKISDTDKKTLEDLITVWTTYSEHNIQQMIDIIHLQDTQHQLLQQRAQLVSANNAAYIELSVELQKQFDLIADLYLQGSNLENQNLKLSQQLQTKLSVLKTCAAELMKLTNVNLGSLIDTFGIQKDARALTVFGALVYKKLGSQAVKEKGIAQYFQNKDLDLIKLEKLAKDFISEDLLKTLSEDLQTSVNSTLFLLENVWPLIEDAQTQHLPLILIQQAGPALLPILTMEMAQKTVDNGLWSNLANALSHDIIEQLLPMYIGKYESIAKAMLPNAEPEVLQRLTTGLKQAKLDGKHPTYRLLARIYKDATKTDQPEEVLIHILKDIKFEGTPLKVAYARITLASEDQVAYVKPFIDALQLNLHTNAQDKNELIRAYIEAVLLQRLNQALPKDGTPFVSKLFDEILEIAKKEWLAYDGQPLTQASAQKLIRQLVEKLTGLTSADDLVELPPVLRQVVYDQVTALAGEYVLYLDTHVRTFCLDETRIADLKNKLNDLLTPGLAEKAAANLGAVGIDILPSVLREKNRDGRNKVAAKTAKGIEKFIGDLEKAPSRAAKVLLDQFTQTDSLQTKLEDLFNILGDPTIATKEKEQAKKLIGNFLLEPLHAFYKKALAHDSDATNQQLITDIFTLLATHLEMTRNAQGSEANYLNNAKDIHPAVPTKPIDYTDEIKRALKAIHLEDISQQKLYIINGKLRELGYQDLNAESMLSHEKLFAAFEDAHIKLTPEDKKALKAVRFKHLVRLKSRQHMDQRYDKLYAPLARRVLNHLYPDLPAGQVKFLLKTQLLPTILSSAVESLMDQNMIGSILVNSLEAGAASLNGPIGESTEPPQDTTNGALDAASQKVMTELLQIIQLPNIPFVNKRLAAIAETNGTSILSNSMRGLFKEQFIKSTLESLTRVLGEQKFDFSEMTPQQRDAQRKLESESLKKRNRKALRDCINATLKNSIRSAWKNFQRKLDAAWDKFGLKSLKHMLDKICRVIFFKIVGTILSIITWPLRKLSEALLHWILNTDRQADALLQTLSQPMAYQPAPYPFAARNENFFYKLVERLIPEPVSV